MFPSIEGLYLVEYNGTWFVVAVTANRVRVWSMAEKGEITHGS
jgi:flagellar biogenesis protein FliO